LQDLAVFDYDDDFEAKLSESMDYQIYIPRKGDSILLSDTLDFKLVDLILSEGHVFQKELDSSILIDGKKISSYTVQKDYYFFIGDNILSSYDSRNFGFVSEENLLGKILCIALSFNSKYDVWYKRLNWSRVAIIPK
jgi:signal peptidase I